MVIGDVPTWVSSVGALIGTTFVAGALAWNEGRKSRKKDPAPMAGDTQVVAASFVDKSLLERLIVVMTSLNSSVVTLNGHVAELNERMHDEEIVRAAAARMRDTRS